MLHPEFEWHRLRSWCAVYADAVVDSIATEVLEDLLLTRNRFRLNIIIKRDGIIRLNYFASWKY